MDTIKLLQTRRSVKAVMLTEPGPSAEDLETILRAGMRVPDHGKLAPWRFVVIDGEARQTFGDFLADIYLKNNPEARVAQLQFNRDLALRAPVIVAVVCKLQTTHKIPVWEQELSSGAACQNMLIAATALGYGGQWLTEWPAYDPDILATLGGEADDRIAGFLYFGTPSEKPDERPRPEYDEIVSRWTKP